MSSADGEKGRIMEKRKERKKEEGLLGRLAHERRESNLKGEAIKGT